MAAKDLMFKIAIFDETSETLNKIQRAIGQMEASVSALQQNMNRIPGEFNSWASRINELKMPDLTKFNEQLVNMGAAMNKVDASSIKSLQRVLKDIQKLQDDFTDKGLKAGFSNLGQSMDKATGDMGKATVTSLKEYQDKVVSSFADFKARLGKALGTQGGLNLFPSDEKWKSTQETYQKLVKQTTEFYTALDRNMGDLGIISELARRIGEVTEAVANVKKALRNQDLLVDIKDNTNRSIDSIITKIGELEAKMGQLGSNTSFPGLTSFVSSLEETVKKIHGQIESLNNVGGGSGGSSAATQQTEAINATSEAYKKQEYEVEKLTKMVGNLQTSYQKSLEASNKFVGQDLDKLRISKSYAVGDAEERLEKQLRSVFGGQFGNIFYKNLSSRETGNISPQTLYDDYVKAALSNNKKGLEAARNSISSSAVYDTFRGEGPESALSFFNRLSEGAKKNSQDYKIAQYALEEYAKAAQIAKTPNFNGVITAYKELQDANAKYNKVHSDIYDAKELKNREEALNKAKKQLQKEREVLDRMKEQRESAVSQPKQGALNFDPSVAEQEAQKLVSPFNQAEQRIKEIIAKIGEDVNGLHDVNGSGVVQGLNNVVNSLSQFENAVSKVGDMSTKVMGASIMVAKMKDNLSEIKNQETAGDGKGKGNDSLSMKDMAKNIETVDSALTKLYNTYQAVSNARKTIAANGGDVSNIDSFLEKLNKVRQALLEVRNDENLLGQKGTLLIPRDGKIGNLAEQLTNIMSGNTIGKPIETMKDLMDAAKQLTTVKGGPFREVTAQANDFTKQANEYAAAAAKVKKAQDDLAIKRDSVVSLEKTANANGLDVSKLRSLFDEINTLQKKLAGEPNAKSAASYLTKDYETLTKRINEASRAQQESIDNKARLESRMTPLTQYISSAQDTLDKANGLGISNDAVDRLQNAINLARQLKDDVSVLSKADWVDNNKISALITQYTDVRNTILNAASAVSTLNSKQESLNNQQTRKDEAQARKDAQAQMQSWGDATEKLSTYKHEIEKVSQLIKDMQDMNARRGTGMDTSALERYLGFLNEIYTKLQEINGHGTIGAPNFGKTIGGELYSSVVAPYEKNELKAGKLAVADSSKQLAQAVREETAEQKKAEQMARQAAQTNKELENSQNSVAKAMENASRAGSHQSQVMSDLKSLAAQYISVWGAQQFISDMVNITGELELQEKSLEVILGNASVAREMYSQIRDLSQMSPYTFEDLLKSHRQLAAFGIEAKDIFGTLKSLSDIGAGLDVDVSRLILAYGHTKSYGYLSGIQNRQFETAGIDLVGALTDHYNKFAEAEKNAGNQAQFVTRADIFKRMRDRSIPFTDVQSVIMDLDKPGGKFYNMQIKQYDTLGGKLRNLRNNYRIMQSEMGHSSEGFLNGIVNTINDVTANWQRYARVLKGVAVAYGVMKLAALAAGRSVVAGERQITQNALMRNRGFASTAYLNGQTSFWNAAGAGSQWSWIANPLNQSRITPLSKGLGTAKDIAQSKELNNITKQRIALSNKLSEAQRYYILRSTGVDMATARSMATMSGTNRMLVSMKLRFMGAAQAAKAFAVSMLTNPMTWVMAAVAGLTALISKTSEMSELSKTLKDNLGDAAKTNIDGIKQTLSEYEGMYDVQKNASLNSSREGMTAELHYVDLDKAQLQGRDVEELFNDLKQKLETESPIFDKDFFNVMKAKDQAGQIKEEFNTLKRLQYVNQVVDQTKSDIGGAIDAGHFKWYSPGTWFKGEDFMTNAKDYENAYQEMKNSISLDDNAWSKLTADQQQKITSYMKALGTTRDEAAAAYLRTHNKDYQMAEAVGAGSGKLLSLNNAASDIGSDTGDVKRLGNSIANTIMSSFTDAKGNLDTMGASEYFGQIVNQIMADAKVGTPDNVAELSDNIMVATVAALRGQGKVAQADQFESAAWEQSIGAAINNMLGQNITKGMTPSQANSIANNTINSVIRSFEAKSPEFKKFWAKFAKTARGRDILRYWELSGKNYADKLRNAMDWQMRMKHNYHVNINLETDVDYADFIDKMRKNLKTAKEKLKSLNTRIKWALGIDILPDFNFKNVKQIKAFIKLVQGQIKIAALQNKGLVHKYGTTNTSKYSATDKASALETNQKLETDRGVLSILQNDMLPYARALEGEHLPFTDPNKDKTPKKHKTRGGNKRDTFADGIREELRALNDVYEEYKKWYQKVGDAQAIKKVNELFFQPESLLRKKDFSFNDVNDYVKSLERLRQQILDHYGKKGANKAKSTDIYVEIQKTIDNTQLTDLDNLMQRHASNETLWLDRMTKAWETYGKVRKATGDKILAANLSGLGGDNLTNQAQALQDAIAQKIGDMSLKDKSGASIGINFSGITEMGDTQIEDKVKSMLGGTQYEGRINEVVEDLKKWRDLQLEIKSSSIDAYSELVGSMSSYVNIVKKANDELDTQLQYLDVLKRSGLINDTQYSQAVGAATAKTDRTVMQNAPGFKNLLSGNTSYGKGGLQKIGSDAMLELTKQLEAGNISAEEYSKSIKDINDAMDKANSNDNTSMFSTFLDKGFQGVFDRRLQRDKDTQTVASQNMEVAAAVKKQAEVELSKDPRNIGKIMRYQQASQNADAAAEKVDEANAKVQADEKKSAKYKKDMQAMDDLVKSMNKLKGATDLVSNVFDSLGLGDTAAGQAASDASGILGGAISGASSLSALGPYGMAAGAALGVIGSVSQLHDKHLQKKIDDIQSDISKIEGYTQTISQAQQRTLGYDYGNVIRGYQSMYSNGDNINVTGAARRAMSSYYNAAGGGDITGYQQQYNLLVQKRKDYSDMYNAENKKKKKSKDSLEEYKSKIADLDDQIRYFSEDVAKNLWGIDVKSWADQISDALASAFENGEDAATAYGDTVRSILQSIASKMMQMEILEPMFSNLESQLFGDKDKGTKGVFDPNDITGSTRKMTDFITNFFGSNGEGKKSITAAQEFLNSFEKGIENAGLTLYNDSSSTLSSGISGMSEETADLLAGYVNALRQDVAVIRLMQTQFYKELWPDYVERVTKSYTVLQNIDANVAAIRSVISENGALYQQVKALSDDLHSTIYGNKSIRVQ